MMTRENSNIKEPEKEILKSDGGSNYFWIHYIIKATVKMLTIALEHIQSGILYGLSALILVSGLFFLVINRKLMSGTKLLTK